MRINFSKIEIHNFMSFADEVFDYGEFKGMNLICGKNNDIPGAKNGTGKCLSPDTQLTIEADENIIDLISSTIIKNNNGIGK